ncbi:hypothetical protein [Maribellus mangrovi]|uniref:hypothetical protein n=1 Tax=Maribellus mangrovi TaxID=3133146 RepID=UPI0030EF182E
MNPISVIGAFIMTLAFLAYGIGSVTLERFRIVGNIVLIFMSLGILFETAAIVLMILGKEHGGDVLHVWTGSVSFFLFIVNATWVWLHYLRNGIDAAVGKSLVNYTKTAFFIWVVAYLAGIVLLIWL